MERLVGKEGNCQIFGNWRMPRNSPSPFFDFMYDTCRSMLHMRWHTWLFILIGIFPTLWFSFAVTYYIMAKWHGDLDEFRNTNETRCVQNLGTFTSAFLFSIETQERIGYGYRYSNEVCGGVLAQIFIQATVGRIVVLIMGSSFFARFVHPETRTKLVLFSKTAVISQDPENGARCLMFRIGDVDGWQLNAMNCKLFYVDKNESAQTMIPMVVHENGDLFLLPLLVRHEIDHYSPLFALSKKDLSTCNFEIIVVLEGNVASTGVVAHVRTSYVPSEIQWAYSFKPLKLYDPANETKPIQIQYKHFDKTIKIIMSDESVKTVTSTIAYEHRNHYYD